MERKYWKNKILELLRNRSILWLSGVRRAGKTTLVRELEGAAYFDCELPRVRQAVEDAELFFRKNKAPIVIFDEIHRLPHPSEVLKIAADHFPHTKVVATGSSTLAVKAKFSDTLTGRKRQLWLQPATITDLVAFGIDDLDRRMIHGGLPPFLLADQVDDTDFNEWMESYWAKDVMELFRVEKRGSFLKFIELLFRQSGELFEAQAFSTPCEISRQTVFNYLAILEVTLLVIVLRPYHEGSAVEIKSQPKVYAFDTGFICFFKGIDTLRDEDRGHFLEHLVLGELLTHFNRNDIYYWRDKQQHEVDFIVKTGRGGKLLAIECKKAARRGSRNRLESFRKRYPEGKNLLISLDDHPPFYRSVNGLEVQFCGFKHLPGVLAGD